jgi:dihydrofolate reductase
MGKVIYSMGMSLDGFIEAPDGSIDFTNPDAELHQYFNDLESSIGMHLYGRRLYENMAAFWPTADEDPAADPQTIEYAQIWRPKPKAVFSTSLHDVGWNARLFREVVPEEVERLKQETDKDLSLGGAGLARSFLRLGLIDEFHLVVHPVLLGGGKPMFGEFSGPVNLRLVESRTFGRGVVMLHYRK